MYFTVMFATRIVTIHFDTTAGSQCASWLAISLISHCLAAAFSKPSSSRHGYPQDVSVMWKEEGRGKGCYCCLVDKSCLILSQPHGLWPTSLLCPWGIPGRSTGVCCHFLLQGIFLEYWTLISFIGRQILYHWPTREAWGKGYCNQISSRVLDLVPLAITFRIGPLAVERFLGFPNIY